jgi:hypothetical protein
MPPFTYIIHNGWSMGVIAVLNDEDKAQELFEVLAEREHCRHLCLLAYPTDAEGLLGAARLVLEQRLRDDDELDEAFE